MPLIATGGIFATTKQSLEPTMILNRLTALTLAALMSLGIAAVVADDTAANAPLAAAPAAGTINPADAVKERRALMMADGKTLQGSADFTGDKAAAAMQTVLNNFNKLPTLFVTDSIIPKSNALPKIWTDWAAFAAIFNKGAVAAADGLAAAKAGDMTKYVADVQTIADTCNTCHDTFRKPRQ